MIGVKVSVVRYLCDEPLPGIVECEFVDAHGRLWSFAEKTAIVSDAKLDRRSSFPQSGVIACQVVGRRIDEKGCEIVLVNTDRPWGVEAADGTTQFEVTSASLLEWEWGAKPPSAPDCYGIP